ncbi:MAG: thioesterase family protein [Hyphomicrobiales bacterium]|nr:thioesterase family protein [Hyphomicrobiales bacterium]
MRPIPVGAKGRSEIVVGPEHLASTVKSAILPPVLATPIMILLMENAALEAVRPYLEASESCVGTHVDVAHLAATPEGRRVIAEARVTGIDGRRISFAVTARDEREEIGRGRHERVVIDMAAFSERLKKK